MKKILIVRYEHIGDYGLTISPIASIRRAFPEAQIDIVVGPWNKKFAEATPYVNNVIVFDNPLVKRNISYGDILKIILFKFFKIKKHLKELEKKNYDILIDFSDRKFSLILDKMIKAKKKILGTDYPYIGEREVDRMNRILAESLGIKKIVKRGILNFSEKDKKVVTDLIKKFKKGNQKIILVHPIASVIEKDWPLDKLEKLIKEIAAKRKDLMFFLLGGPEQEKEILEIENQIKLPNVKSIAGKLDLLQLVLLMHKSDLIFGGDSAPVHLAELTKIPIITLYGPSDHRRWGPPKGQGIIVKGDTIKDIKAKDILKAINHFIKI